MSNIKYAVCRVPVSPLRVEPNHLCEIYTQQLFGEICSILEETKDGWTKVKCLYDGEEGWCQSRQLVEIIDKNFTPPSDTLLAPEWVNEIEYKGQIMRVPFGSSWPVAGNKHLLEGLKLPAKPWDTVASSINTETIRKIAFTYLNTSYLWGGKSVFGIDCSGFSQSVYKFLGISIRRNARDQVLSGEPIGFLQEAVCGDLAFFDDEEGKIVHVGILLNSEEIIHSSARVKIDKIDNMGIIDTDTGKRSHRLRIIKRYF